MRKKTLYLSILILGCTLFFLLLIGPSRTQAFFQDNSGTNLDNYLKTTPNVYRTGLIFQDPITDPAGRGVQQIVPLGNLPKYQPLQTTSHFNYEYLPPVNSQGAQSSCVAWAVGYYLKTYQENKEDGRTDLAERTQPQNIYSPAFIYNLIHLKNDQGAYFSDAFRVINDFGCPSLQEMPYNDHDYQTWPDENDFETAIRARTMAPSGGEYYWLYLGSDSALDQVKQIILNGGVVVFGIYVYDNYYSIGSYNNIYALAGKTGSSHGGHAQTIVGYDDNLVTPDGVGAFRVVNSWGSGWGDGGYYWITYEAVKAGSDYSQGYVFWVDDRVSYDSQKKILFKLEHDYSRETDTWVTVGGNQINFFDFYVKQKEREYQSYPDSSIVLDVQDLAAFLLDGAEVRLYMMDVLTNAVSGSILQFTYQDEANALSVDSLDPPVSVADGTQNYASLTLPTLKKAIISLNRDNLVFGADESGLATTSQELVISNSGEGNMTWTIIPQDTWLMADPLSGENSQIVQVSVDPKELVSGNYSSYLTINSPDASNSPLVLPVELKVMTTGTSSGPMGYLDTPGEGVTVYGNVPVTGWALDDVEVEKVEVKREPVASDPPEVIGPDGLVYIGDAVFVEGARPDVETAYPNYPLSYRAGWGYMMLTNFLPNSGNGDFTIYAIAYDKEGHQVTLGTKTITCDNANSEMPFGTIDTPLQGGTVSGNAYVNFGWALTPQPKYIPTDGSTIWVFVDGVPLGHPVYNNYRADIATLFPGYANSDGAVGFYLLDTTAFDNGVHNIAWSVTDSEGAITGIGSRYFEVQNLGSMASLNKEMIELNEGETPRGNENSRGGLGSSRNGSSNSRIEWSKLEKLPLRRSVVLVRRGYNLEGEARELIADGEGVIHLEIREVERVEVSLNGESIDFCALLNDIRANDIRNDKKANDVRIVGLRAEENAFIGGRGKEKSKSPYYTAYLVVGEKLRPLPVGSTLLKRRGVFFWQPGPGFLGDYNLVFICNEAGVPVEKVRVQITIKPKFQKK